MRRQALIAVLLLASPAVGGAAAIPVPRDDEVRQTLFLIGDAGKPAKGGEPVLAALRREVEETRASATVVFLGDNVYPAGLHPAKGLNDDELVRRLDDQLDALSGTRARVILIPGNHDWAKGAADGWAALLRQEKHVEMRGLPNVSFMPKGGCPGPEVVSLGELRLVALDTQWWLHRHARPQGGESGCAAGTEAEVVAALEATLTDGRGSDTVVVAHHPLQTGGPHGGHFGFREHVFPLTAWKRWLYLPLPIVGSAYPISRRAGISSQDLGHGAYERMREALAGAMEGHRPLAWAAGHEHSLQVIESPRWGRVLVSGAGIYGHVTSARSVDGSLYRAAQAGFMRIDFLRDGRRRLGVIVVHADSRAEEAFARLLE